MSDCLIWYTYRAPLGFVPQKTQQSKGAFFIPYDEWGKVLLLTGNKGVKISILLLN